MKKLITLITLLFGITFAEMVILNTFNAGELSSHLDARIDFQKYQSGLRTLENFIVLPYGGAVKRSGTQYIANTKSNGVARLVPFSVGVEGRLRLWRRRCTGPCSQRVLLRVGSAAAVLQHYPL